MKRRHKELMQQVAAAKPDLSARTDSWVESGRSGELLDEILAKTDETTEPDPSRTRRAGTRPRGRAGGRQWTLIATAAFVLVGLAAFVVFYLAPSLSGQDQTALQPEGTTIPGVTVGPTATTAPDVTAGVVTKAEALEGLLRFAAEHPEYSVGRPHVAPGNPRDELKSAKAMGLVRETEIGADGLSRPATRKEYAIWLTRGWLLPSPATDAAPTMTDAAALTPEEKRAAEIVLALGILALDAHGAFRGDEVLTHDQAATALRSLGDALSR